MILTQYHYCVSFGICAGSFYSIVVNNNIIHDQTTPLSNNIMTRPHLFQTLPMAEAEAEGSTASNSPAQTHRENSGGEREEENALASGILGILAPAVRHVDEKVGEVRSVL